MNEFASGHPYYITESKATVQEWLLGLRSSDDLFSTGTVVPSGVDRFKGQQWSTLFSRVEFHFAYFKDDGANRLITSHLDELFGEIKSRLTTTTPSPNSSPLPPPPKALSENELPREQNAVLQELLAAALTRL